MKNTVKSLVVIALIVLGSSSVWSDGLTKCEALKNHLKNSSQAVFHYEKACDTAILLTARWAAKQSRLEDLVGDDTSILNAHRRDLEEAIKNTAEFGGEAKEKCGFFGAHSLRKIMLENEIKEANCPE